MDIPSLRDFDMVHVGVSGGKDSTALMMWALFESGIPHERLTISFCDTGNEDALTYAFLDLLRTFHPIEVIHPDRDFWELAEFKGRFPSTKARFCTVELKVIPSRTKVLELLRTYDNVVVLNGVRRGEAHTGNNRGSALEWELDVEGWGTWIHRPLVDWSIQQVWDMHKKYISLDAVMDIVRNDPTMTTEAKDEILRKMQDRGVPCNPLYYMAATRVGCYPCINSNKGEMRAMTHYRPERIDFIEGKELNAFTHTKAGISTFFRRNAVPQRWRSRPITTKKGETVLVPTIRDVAEWSATARGGKQYPLLLEDEFEDAGPASACDIGGMCE